MRPAARNSASSPWRSLTEIVAVEQIECRAGTSVDQLDEQPQRAVVVCRGQQSSHRRIDGCGGSDQRRLAVVWVQLVVVDVPFGTRLGVPDEARVAGLFDQEIAVPVDI